jgi:site-specific DNA recombinase
MKGIIYTRVSSDEQVKGTSLDDQDFKCRQYCAEKGIEVVKLFKEEGASAKSADRKEFLNAINFCAKHKGEVEAFVVLRVDRFARNTEDHFSVRKILADYKVTLHSVTEPIGNNPIEKFMETLLAASAEFDNSIRARRCSDGMIAKVKQGIWPWKPPIGYKCLRNKSMGQKKTEPDQPDEQTFSIIQRSLKEYSTGMYSQSDIGRLLDHAGLSKITGKKSSLQLVDRILDRYLKFYTGILSNKIMGDDSEYAGLHKPMITREEMQKIIFLKSGGKISIKRERLNLTFPLKRTVLCNGCGGGLTGSSSSGNGGKYDYYHCYDKKCELLGKVIAKEDLEKDFMAYLDKVTPQKEFLAIFNASVLEEWKDQGQLFESQAILHEARLKVLQTKKKQVYTMRENQEYNAEEFKARKEEVENEIITENISRSESRIDQFDMEAALAYANHFITNISRQWFDCSPQLRARFQKLVFPEGIVYYRKEGFRTAKLGYIYTLNQQFFAQKSHMVDPTGLEPATPSLQMRCSTR